MAKIDDLLADVADEEPLAALVRGVHQLRRNKKFGLVFEEHISETTLLGVGIRVSAQVIVRTDTDSVRYLVGSTSRASEAITQPSVRVRPGG